MVWLLWISGLEFVDWHISWYCWSFLVSHFLVYLVMMRLFTFCFLFAWVVTCVCVFVVVNLFAGRFVSMVLGLVGCWL